MSIKKSGNAADVDALLQRQQVGFHAGGGFAFQMVLLRHQEVPLSKAGSSCRLHGNTRSVPTLGVAFDGALDQVKKGRPCAQN